MEIADLAVRGDDLIAAGVGEGPAIGAALRRLLAAVVDEPSLNERDTLLRLAIAPETIERRASSNQSNRSTSIAACSSAWI